MFDLSDPRSQIYARPPEYWKIFVSSKMAGGALRAERATTIEAIDAFALTRAWAWERNANAGPYSSERECVMQAGTSDGLVLILDDELTDITRKEFEAARGANAPVFLMLRAGADRDGPLQQFIEEARGFAITVNFSSLDELRTQVVLALRTWALRSGRSAILRAADSASSKAPTRPTSLEDAGAIEVHLVDSQAHVRVGDVVGAARQLIAAGDAEAALTDLWELVEASQDSGRGWLALELVDEIERTVSAEVLDQRWRGWLLNARGLALSDAERHTESSEAFEHMRQIGQALEDRDLEGTALQNLGVQHVIAGRLDDARSCLRRSLEIKHSVEDLRGGLQVLFNLVNVFLGESNFDAAERLLADLDDLLVGVRDPALRTSLHGLRGSLAVAQEDFGSARRHFGEALRAARRARSVPRIITAMQNLGAVAADLGDLRRARQWYAKALDLAETVDDLAQRRIQRQALALSLVRLGEPLDAAELFEQASEEAMELGDRKNAAVALADAGACFMEAGDAESARSRTERALAMRAGTDESWRAGQLLNLATELHALGEPERAVQHTLEAANLQPAPQEQAAALRRAGELAIEVPALALRAPSIFEQELSLRRVHEPSVRWAWRAAEIGTTLSETSQSKRARHFYSTALRVFARRGDQRQAFFIRNDRALVSADVGDLRAAATDLRACLKIAEDLDDRSLRQQAHMNYGEIERRRGRHDSAADHLNLALELARELEDLRLRGSTAGLLAHLSLDLGDFDDAELHLGHVEEVARTLREPNLRAQAAKGRAAIAFERGQYMHAGRHFERAASLLSEEQSPQLAESLGGCVVSAAWRGKLDSEALERLVVLSEALGWDADLSDELMVAFAGLVRAGRKEDIAEVAAVGLAVATRLWLSSETTDEGFGTPDEEADPLTAIALIVAHWAISEPHAGLGERQAMLRAALEDAVGTKLASELGSLVAKAAGALMNASPGRTPGSTR